LLINFSGRRYHATPWGHHVNEGLVEWPPSPWRLLRALLATGYTKLGWPGDGPPKAARDLIEKLATTLPRYRLPSAAGAHSRHYMPLAVLDKGREKTTMVFDTWAQVDDGVLAVHWDVVLAEEETETLRAITENLGYLGRSESWVTASLVPDDAPVHEGTDAVPCEDGIHRGPGWEQIPLLAPVSSSDYVDWRRAAVDEALSKLEDVDLTKKKLTKGEKKRVDTIDGSYPPDLVACLQVQTKWLRKLGWSQPPGSRRVFYWRKADTLEAGAPKPKQRYIEATPVEAMLLSMATASGNDHALPNIFRTLPQAELLHLALASWVNRLGKNSVALTGRDAKGDPLKDQHRHAHLIPLDLDGDGHLEHILIWAAMGLDAQAQAAIRAVRRTFTKGGTGPLRLGVAASGSLADLRYLIEPFGTGLSAFLGPSTIWRSHTPFVPSRYLKKHGRNTLEGQITAELQSRGYPLPKRVSEIDLRDSGLLRFRHFVRTRRSGSTPPVDCGFAIELEFGRPVKGPVSLGYGCHFGLGLFSSMNDGQPLQSAN
jgi:CRISPR-associated protein Csb2